MRSIRQTKSADHGALGCFTARRGRNEGHPCWQRIGERDVCIDRRSVVDNIQVVSKKASNLDQIGSRRHEKDGEIRLVLEDLGGYFAGIVTWRTVKNVA